MQYALNVSFLALPHPEMMSDELSHSVPFIASSPTVYDNKIPDHEKSLPLSVYYNLILARYCAEIMDCQVYIKKLATKEVYQQILSSISP